MVALPTHYRFVGVRSCEVYPEGGVLTVDLDMHDGDILGQVPDEEIVDYVRSLGYIVEYDGPDDYEEEAA